MSVSSENINIVESEVREQQIEQIIVFADRAEVRRSVKVQLKDGINEIRLKNICQSFIHDSLRVEGRGNATIHDVVIKDQPAIKEESDSPKVASLRANLKAKQVDVNGLEDRRTTVNKKLEMLEKVFGEKGSFKIDENTSAILPGLLSMYAENAGGIREELRRIEGDLENANALVRKAEQELNIAEGKEMENRFARTAHITIEAAGDGEAVLDITYQVYNASWSPDYAIRVDTAKPTMNIAYSAKIRQHTGEDWTESPLVLSTAQPCVGGHIPELGTLEAMFYVKPDPPMMRTMAFSAAPMMAKSRALGRNAAMAADSVAEPEMCVAVAANVTQKALSAEFQILRNSTIPNGTDDHKVTIGIVDLTPSLAYETVPSKNTSAFLTAVATNESELTFVAGQASIFLNNSFVAKTHLKDVSPGEKFTCSLGVDAAIRISYKPAKKNHASSGLINKHSVNVTEQTIVVKNTKLTQEHPVLLTVKHHVPRSTDETIRVTLQSPTAAAYSEGADGSHPTTEGARINSDGNLEWTVQMAAGETKNLLVKYTVEHPKDQKIEFRERF